MTPTPTPIIIGATGLVGSGMVKRLREFAVYVSRNKTLLIDPNYFFVSHDMFGADSSLFWSRITAYNNLGPLVFLAFPTNLAEVEEYNTEMQSEFLKNFTAHIIQAEKYNIPLFFLSSDAIFWGSAPYKRSVTDAPNPVNVYGKLKTECEKIIRQEHSNWLIVRCVPVGIHPLIRQSGFLGLCFKAFEANEAISGYVDNFINPVSTDYLADFIVRWINQPSLFNKEIIHLCLEQPVSKFEILRYGLNILKKPELVREAFFKPTTSPKRVPNQTLLPLGNNPSIYTQSVKSFFEDLNYQLTHSTVN